MVDGVVDFAILAVSIVSVLLGVTLLAAGEVFALTAIIIGVLSFASLKTDIDQISEWRSFQSSRDTDPQQDALTILRERYARGEIDQNEFERRDAYPRLVFSTPLLSTAENSNKIDCTAPLDNSIQFGHLIGEPSAIGSVVLTTLN